MNNHTTTDQYECELAYDFATANTSSSSGRFPTSSIRDEPYTPVTPPIASTSRCNPISHHLACAATAPSSEYTYVRPVEIQQGVMSDGTITERHPMVVHYLAQLSQPQHAATICLTVANGKGKQKMSEAVRRSVCAAAGTTALSEFQCLMVYALAALAVFQTPTHPAHFAFWHQDTMEATGDIVTKVVCTYPLFLVFVCLLTSLEWMFPPQTRSRVRSRHPCAGSSRTACYGCFGGCKSATSPR